LERLGSRSVADRGMISLCGIARILGDTMKSIKKTKENYE
jgi:hypothetical protein